MRGVVGFVLVASVLGGIHTGGLHTNSSGTCIGIASLSLFDGAFSSTSSGSFTVSHDKLLGTSSGTFSTSSTADLLGAVTTTTTTLTYTVFDVPVEPQPPHNDSGTHNDCGVCMPLTCCGFNNTCSLCLPSLVNGPNGTEHLTPGWARGTATTTTTTTSSGVTTTTTSTLTLDIKNWNGTASATTTSVSGGVESQSTSTFQLSLDGYHHGFLSCSTATDSGGVSTITTSSASYELVSAGDLLSGSASCDTATDSGGVSTSTSTTSNTWLRDVGDSHWQGYDTVCTASSSGPTATVYCHTSATHLSNFVNGDALPAPLWSLLLDLAGVGTVAHDKHLHGLGGGMWFRSAPKASAECTKP